MKPLTDLKDETAKSFGYKNNEDLISHMNPAWINEQIDTVAKRYAEAVIERCVELADLQPIWSDGINRDMILKVKKELQ